IGTLENENNLQTSTPAAANHNLTTQLPENNTASSSFRKRRPSTVIRSESPASPLPVASALTMSESLYNYFRPLDKDVPEDHRLPFLDFGKKLVPASVKTTSSLASSTSSTNSIDGKIPTSSVRTTHNLREDEIHEDMDVSVVKSVIEKNKASRARRVVLPKNHINTNQTTIYSNLMDPVTTTETTLIENGTNNNISNTKENDLATAQPSLPTQLTASSSVIEATVSTPFVRGRNNSIPTTFKPPRNLTKKIEANANTPNKSNYTALRNITNVKSPPISTLKTTEIQNEYKYSDSKSNLEPNTESNFRIENGDDEKSTMNSDESYTTTNVTLDKDILNKSSIILSQPVSQDPSLTSSIQSPTTKILSTAVVTSVSVKGAWPEGVSDNPPLDSTSIPRQNDTNKGEQYEHTLEPPGYSANITNHSEILIDKSPSESPLENASTTIVDSFTSDQEKVNFESVDNKENNEENPSFSSDSPSTPVTMTNFDVSEQILFNKETSSLPSNTLGSFASDSEITTKTSLIIRNSSRIPRTDTSPVNNPKTNTVQTTFSTNINGVSRGLTTTDHPATIRAKEITHSSSSEYFDPKVSMSTAKSSSIDSEFDFPLLKLYNASTVWSLSSRPGNITSTEDPGRVSTQDASKISAVSVATSQEGTTLNSSIHDGDETAKNNTRDKSESGTTDVPHNRSSGTLGNVWYNNKTNLTSQGPRESSENIIVSAQGASIAVYVLSALGIVPLSIGVALAAKYFVQRRRKLLDDTDAYSDISSRRGARSGGGHTGSDIGSPVSGTKLPRVQTHLTWDPEKTNSTLMPVTNTRWEFPRSKLRLQTVLGQGNFGQVLKAEADDISGYEGTTRLVAVKTVKEGASNREKEDLLRELEIMQQLGSHANVVTLLGCCTEKEPYLLIMEYVMYGKLLAFLRDHRTRQHYYNFSEDSDALTSRDLTIFAYCVARGMEYLGTKGIIHRDLAARNVLVDHNKMCKIADFGMSRSVRDTGDLYEQRHTKGALPIRWMAPESLHSGYSHTRSTPYPTMGAREVMRRVKDGYRLERPSHCRIELFRIISRCWHSDPNKRPDFASLRNEIGALIENSQDGGGYVDLETLSSRIACDEETWLSQFDDDAQLSRYFVTVFVTFSMLFTFTTENVTNTMGTPEVTCFKHVLKEFNFHEKQYHVGTEKDYSISRLIRSNKNEKIEEENKSGIYQIKCREWEVEKSAVAAHACLPTERCSSRRQNNGHKITADGTE
ncbi:hypothetical protein L9F63_001672, partial [Diploptera punctata]